VNLAVEFAKRGHRVDLVLARAEGHFFDALPASVRVVDLATRTSFAALPAIARDPRNALKLMPALLNLDPPRVVGSLPALVRYLRAERPEAMFAALDYSNITAIWACHLSGVRTRLVISVQNTLSSKIEHMKARRLRCLPGVIRHFYPWADAIATVSDGVADDLARVTGIPRTAITTTHNPMVTPDLVRAAQQPVDHPWYKPDEPPVLLGIGKLKLQKDFPTLIRAFAKIRQKRPSRLVILGEGPQRSELASLASSLGVGGDVDLPGFVSNPFAFLGHSSVFVLSSLFEGLPSVLMEALACGCPVVSTDCPSGPFEILDGGRYGCLVPMSDPDALAEAVCAALDDPPDPERLLERAQVFSASAVADRVLCLMIGDAA
jgi:glycosyltransferase involved in cell wall biosynthesis